MKKLLFLLLAAPFAAWAQQPVAKMVPIGDTQIDLIWVEGGTFTMGATAEQPSTAPVAEKPAHEVTLSDFWIGKYEITQEVWEAVMGSEANPSLNRSGKNLPVERIPLESIRTFLAKLSTATGRTFRLPTEAEWEYAARGGNRSRGYRYSGSDDAAAVAWNVLTSGGSTHPVGTKAPNELGIHDMSGNVWEWCSDLYGKYAADPQRDPKGAAAGSYYVVRGGSWCGEEGSCWVSHRSYDAIESRVFINGFRIVMEP